MPGSDTGREVVLSLRLLPKGEGKKCPRTDTLPHHPEPNATGRVVVPDHRISRRERQHEVGTAAHVLVG
jgi:hypothetical protein